MKKWIMTLSLVFACFGMAHGAVQDFESVTVDVPEGWVVQEHGPAIIVVSPDQTGVVSLITAPSEGMSAKSIAEHGSKSVNGSPVKEEEGGVYSFTFEQGGQKGRMLVSAEGENATAITVMGTHPMLDKVARSVKLK